MGNRKKIELYLIIAFFMMLGCLNPNNGHIGEWKGVDDEGNEINLVLDKDGYTFLMQGNQVIGGKDFEVKGVRAECRYKIDYSKKPVWLDIVFYEQHKNKEKGRFKGIVRFITENKIEYRVDFDGGERFDKFDMEDESNTIVLEKVVN